MGAQLKNMENEIGSLASTIKKNMVDPTGQRLRDIEDRLAAAERSLAILGRSLLLAGAIFAVTMGTIIYHLAK